MNHVSLSPTHGYGPTQGQRKTLTGVGIERISLPFENQVSANAVRRQLRDLINKIGPTLQPLFVSKKFEQDLKAKEAKPSIVNQQCVVYHFFMCSVRWRLCRLHSPTPFFSVLVNTEIRQSASIFMKRMLGEIF